MSERNRQDTGAVCRRQAKGDLSTPRFLGKGNEWRSSVLAGKLRAQHWSEQGQVDLSSRPGTQGAITLITDVLPLLPAPTPPFCSRGQHPPTPESQPLWTLLRLNWPPRRSPPRPSLLAVLHPVQALLDKDDTTHPREKMEEMGLGRGAYAEHLLPPRGLAADNALGRDQHCHTCSPGAQDIPRWGGGRTPSQLPVRSRGASPSWGSSTGSPASYPGSYLTIPKRRGRGSRTFAGGRGTPICGEALGRVVGVVRIGGIREAGTSLSITASVGRLGR